LIPFTPCVLAKGILPKNVDKDASFRANAIFTREEVEAESLAKECDPSGSRFNLRLAVPVDFVAMRAAFGG
jgi:hypothetical protein